MTNFSEVTKKGITLSIALNNSRASGQVFLEDGPEQEFITETFSITAIDQLISFKLESLLQGSRNSAKNLIDEIIVSFVGISQEVNTACALKRDLKTVQTLYTYGWKDRQIRISPRNPEAPENYTPLQIDEVAHIFFMHSPDGAKCDHLSFA